MQFEAVMFGGVFFRFDDLKLLSENIRVIAPNCFQIIGGNLATTSFAIVLQHTSVDCVVRNEGEETIFKVLELITK